MKIATEVRLIEAQVARIVKASRDELTGSDRRRLRDLWEHLLAAR